MKGPDLLGILGSVLAISFLMGGTSTEPPTTSRYAYTSQSATKPTTSNTTNNVDIRPIVNSINTFYSSTVAGYIPPKVSIFNSSINSSCGLVYEVAVYCPADQTIFIRASIAEDLATRGFPNNESSIYYVIGHETGHHVQHILNRSITEHGADCLAGHSARTASFINIEVMANTAYSVGGITRSPYGHGTKSERKSLVLRGYNGTFASCF